MELINDTNNKTESSCCQEKSFSKESFKLKYLKNKHRFFWHENKSNVIKLLITFLICIIFFLLVTLVSLNETTSVDLRFKLNFERTLQMVITGFNLGAATFLLQKITKNRLADPAIVGFGNINLIPITVLVLFTDFSMTNNANMISKNTFQNLTPVIILLTSIIFISFFHFFSREKTKQNYKKIIVAGVIINFISVAIAYSINPLLKYDQAPVVEGFITGFIKNTPIKNVLYSSIFISLLMNVWLLLISKKLQISITNQEIATQLGINNNSIMYQALIIIVTLVACTYMLCGDFVFVGLLAANIGTFMFKNKINSGFYGSGMIGMIIVLLTYFMFDNLIQIELNIIPLMIPLAIAPYFLFLLIKGK